MYVCCVSNESACRVFVLCVCRAARVHVCVCEYVWMWTRVCGYVWMCSYFVFVFCFVCMWCCAVCVCVAPYGCMCACVNMCGCGRMGTCVFGYVWMCSHFVLFCFCVVLCCVCVAPYGCMCACVNVCRCGHVWCVCMCVHNPPVVCGCTCSALMRVCDMCVSGWALCTNRSGPKHHVCNVRVHGPIKEPNAVCVWCVCCTSGCVWCAYAYGRAHMCVSICGCVCVYMRPVVSMPTES